MDASIATPLARAAWSFAGLDQKRLAERSGLKYDRVRAILGDHDQSDVRLEELYAIADACGVPRYFMEVGFAPIEMAANRAAARHLLALEKRIADLERSRTIDASELSRLLADSLGVAVRVAAPESTSSESTKDGPDRPPPEEEGEP